MLKTSLKTHKQKNRTILDPVNIIEDPDKTSASAHPTFELINAPDLDSHCIASNRNLTL